MSEIKVTVDDHRARNIAIGFFVVALLVYWRTSGLLSALAESMLPDPPQGKVSSGAWEFVLQLSADLFAAIGVLVASVTSGLFKLLISLFAKLAVFASSPKPVVNNGVTPEDLIAKANQVLAAIEPHLNTLEQRIIDLESGSIAPKTSPQRQARNRKGAS